jgi:hypothetical protein
MKTVKPDDLFKDAQEVDMSALPWQHARLGRFPSRKWTKHRRIPGGDLIGRWSLSFADIDFVN